MKIINFVSSTGTPQYVNHRHSVMFDFLCNDWHCTIVGKIMDYGSWLKCARPISRMENPQKLYPHLAFIDTWVLPASSLNPQCYQLCLQAPNITKGVGIVQKFCFCRKTIQKLCLNTNWYQFVFKYSAHIYITYVKLCGNFIFNAVNFNL